MKKLQWMVLVFILGMAEYGQCGMRFFRPEFFFGAGYGKTLNGRIPEFVRTDEKDSLYYAINLVPQKRDFFRGQIRVNVFHVGGFSLGYTFWSHYQAYPYDYFSVWIDTTKIKTAYPHSYFISFHALTLEYRGKKIVKPFIQPLFYLGAGQFYGASKNAQFVPVEYSSWFTFYQQNVHHGKSYEGIGYLGGMGVVFFRHAYIAFEYIRLTGVKMISPHYFDAVIGLRI